MTNLEKIIECLQYHPGLSRVEIMARVDLGVSDTQVKGLLAEGVRSGYLQVEGKARATRYSITAKGRLLRTVNLDSYYALSADERAVQTSYNFELIRDELPKIDIFTLYSASI